jgi:NAD(P)H-hydrate epimerase
LENREIEIAGDRVHDPRLEEVLNLPPLPARPRDGHKGTFGTVIVVGGSPTMMGAPALCASAALRSGAGLVKLAVPQELLPVALCIEPGATGVVVTGDALEDARRILEETDPKAKAVLAVGCGIGQSERAGRLVAQVLHRRGGRAMVLDADGLNLLASPALADNLMFDPSVVLTPHPGEFRRLAETFVGRGDTTDPAERPAAAAALARRLGAVVVLKSDATVVTDGQRGYINRSGNPALATAGSGDVLTGVIAGLIAQGMAGFDAAVLGVYLHGRAADFWAVHYGPSGLTAQDLARLLPKAFQEQRQQ